MSQGKLKTQTPGQTIEAKQLPPQEEAQAQPATQAITPEIQALIDEQVKAAIKAERRKAYEKPGYDGDLPQQSEIDSKEIKRAVMSRDGWVCPAPPELPPETVNALRRIM